MDLNPPVGYVWHVLAQTCRAYNAVPRAEHDLRNDFKYTIMRASLRAVPASALR